MNRIAIIFLLFFIKVSSQETTINKESNNLTLDGNIEFADKNLIEAETLYRKSISKDSLNIKASYNLGNSFYRNELKQEAINQYKSSIKKAKSKETIHKSFHNLGNIYMQNEDYQNAVNSFKNALLNNPSDDETRYNYVLAKELLKNQQKDNKKDDKKEMIRRTIRRMRRKKMIKRTIRKKIRKKMIKRTIKRIIKETIKMIKKKNHNQTKYLLNNLKIY